jgi:hypothetical protein
MTGRDKIFIEARHPQDAGRRHTPQSVQPRRARRPLDREADMHALALDEGWLAPPAEVTRISLRPWQQAVFWGLRVYIVVMLIVMSVGFAHIAGQ